MSVASAKMSAKTAEDTKVKFESEFGPTAKTFRVKTPAGTVNLFSESINGNKLAELSKLGKEFKEQVESFLINIQQTPKHPACSPGLRITGLAALDDFQLAIVLLIISHGKSYTSLELYDIDFTKLGEKRVDLLISALANRPVVQKDNVLSKIDLSTCNVGDLSETQFMALCSALAKFPVSTINMAHQSLLKLNDDTNDVRITHYCNLIKCFRGRGFMLNYNSTYNCRYWMGLRLAILENQFLNELGSVKDIEALESRGSNDIFLHLIKNSRREIDIKPNLVASTAVVSAAAATNQTAVVATATTVTPVASTTASATVVQPPAIIMSKSAKEAASTTSAAKGAAAAAVNTTTASAASPEESMSDWTDLGEGEDEELARGINASLS